MVSTVKLEAIGAAEKERESAISDSEHIGLPYIPAPPNSKREETESTIYKRGRERNRFRADSRRDELGQVRLGMEEDTMNLIWVQNGLGAQN